MGAGGFYFISPRYDVVLNTTGAALRRTFAHEYSFYFTSPCLPFAHRNCNFFSISLEYIKFSAGVRHLGDLRLLLGGAFHHVLRGSVA